MPSFSGNIRSVDPLTTPRSPRSIQLQLSSFPFQLGVYEHELSNHKPALKDHEACREQTGGIKGKLEDGDDRTRYGMANKALLGVGG